MVISEKVVLVAALKMYEAVLRVTETNETVPESRTACGDGVVSRMAVFARVLSGV